MLIKTKYHNEIEVNKEDIIHFEKGIPGFIDEKEFIILPISEDQAFSVMQSISTEYLAFLVVNPFHFFPEYDFQIEDLVVEELGFQSKKEVQVFSILTAVEPFENTTANLQAPVVINTTNQKAKQVILNDGQYKTKHPIFQKG
jgi:flagellar assembly factor FliW